MLSTILILAFVSVSSCQSSQTTTESSSLLINPDDIKTVSKQYASIRFIRGTLQNGLVFISSASRCATWRKNDLSSQDKANGVQVDTYRTVLLDNKGNMQIEDTTRDQFKEIDHYYQQLVNKSQPCLDQLPTMPVQKSQINKIKGHPLREKLFLGVLANGMPFGASWIGKMNDDSVSSYSSWVLKTNSCGTSFWYTDQSKEQFEAIEALCKTQTK